MAGDRQLVRRAVAAYFGGSLVTADAGICYQGCPLASAGLGTAYPYSVRNVPDSYYTAGAAPGRNWGVVMSTTKIDRTTDRDSYGGPVSGWRKRVHTITCELSLICELPHIETAGAALDDLIDAMHGLVYADRTLGTTGTAYAAQGGRLIMQAGEKPYGIRDATDKFEEIDAKKGRYGGMATVSFQALTMVAA